MGENNKVKSLFAMLKPLKLLSAKSLSSIDVYLASLLLIWAFIFGLFIRIYPALVSDFPINDGGMFYSMTLDLISNNLKIPAYTSYNNSQIPFTYPPLTFYLLSFLGKYLGNVYIFSLLKWFPPLISFLSVLAFFILANEIFGNYLFASLATTFFALMPNTFIWIIMGGGVTRALGMLFHIFSLWAYYRLFTHWRYTDSFMAILFSSLSLLTHPSWALHTLFIGIVFWVLIGRRKINTKLLITGIVIALIIAPFGLVVLSNHGENQGFLYYIRSLRTGFQSILGPLMFILWDIASEPYLDLVSVVALIGLFHTIRKRDYLYLAWLAIPFLIDPRTANTVSTTPLSLISTLGLMRIIEATFTNKIGSDYATSEWLPTVFSDIIFRIFFAVFLIYPLVGGFAYSYVLARLSLPQEHRQAFNWVKHNVSNGRFLLLTGEQGFVSPVREWFPALTNNIGTNVVQGTEWLGKMNFVFALNYSLEQCITKGIDCIEQVITNNFPDYRYDYIYLYLGDIPTLNPHEPLLRNNMFLIEFTLRNSERYELVYQDNNIRIYKLLDKKVFLDDRR